MFGYTGRYPIVTCSGVVVRDEGNVTSTGLRIASASAAVVVSAAVVGAALFGGSAISDPGAPADQDQRLVAIPATPSPYPTVTPSRLSRSPRASAHSRPECQRPEKPAVCHRELKKQATATPLKRLTTSARNAETVANRRAPTATETYHSKSTPSRKPTQAAKSAAAKSASSSASDYATRSDWAKAVLAELNAERANHGLPAMKLNSKLVSAAHAHNLAIAKANKLSHQLNGEAALGSRVSAAGYSWSAVGENVAYSTSRSQSGVLAVQKAMYNEKPPDDGHRRNILSKTYVDVGIDVISDSVHGKVWLVTDFGRP
jgi:uncharacterized protein YkwD